MRHGRLPLLLGISALGIAYAACGVTYVKGPDGNLDWFKVECRRDGNCIRKAAKQCPNGFLMAESETSTSTYYEKAPAGDEEDAEGRTHTMLARCGGEKEETRRDEDDEPFRPITKPKNLAGCGKAFDQIDELAKAWLEWHPAAEAPAAKPTRSEFVTVCGDLPESAQFCLVVKYGNLHQSECKDEFENIPQKNRVRLAKLFEKDGDDPKDMIVAKPPVDLDASTAEAGAGDAGKDGGAPKPKPGAKPAPVADAGIKAAVIPDAGVKKGPSDAAAE